MSLILPNLYLGDKDDAKKISIKMTMVVNCSNHLPFYNRNIKNIRIPVNDPGNGCSLEHVEQQKFMEKVMPVLDEIDKEIRRGGKVLVHCHAGIQRSAAVVLLYIVLKARWRVPMLSMNLNKKKYNYAKKYLISRRPIVFYANTDEFISFQCAIDEILGF